MNTELAKQEQTDVALFDYGESAGADMEATKEEVLIPFLTILQGTHEEVKKQLIPGATMGSILDNVTERLFDGEKGVHLVAVHRSHVVDEWPNEEDGGNLKVATHELTSQLWQDVQVTQKSNFPNFVNPDTENRLQETVYLWALLVDGDRVSPVVVVFKSKKLKYWKRWNSKALAVQLASGQKPPYFAHQLRLTTWEDQSDNGPHANVTLRPLNGNFLDSLLAPDSPLLAKAAEMRKQIADGFWTLDPRGDGSSDGENEEGSEIPLDPATGKPIF